MPGRSTLLGVDEALALILADVTPVGTETVTLDDAHHRTLREDVIATLSQPPFAASSMDGYAVCAKDVVAAPVELKVTGEAAAGHPYDKPLSAGEAVRIFTGAPLPENADAIVIQEDVDRDGNVIKISDAVGAGTYVRPAGGDFKEGQTLLAAGRQLSSRDLMLSAANGVTDIAVSRAPRVGILATGDEVVHPGAVRTKGQIFSSVPAGLTPLIRAFGGAPVLLGIAPDNRKDLDAALERASDCDIVVTIGGASVGDHDLVHDALKAYGVDLAFWKIAMRPGKPLMSGKRRVDERTQHFIGLPGNPVSGMICGRIFIVPLIAAMLGRTHAPLTPDTMAFPLAEPLSQNGVRRHYMRAQYVDRDGTRMVAAMANQDSSLMSLLAEADCLIVRRRGEKAAAIGDMVDILPLDF